MNNILLTLLVLLLAACGSEGSKTAPRAPDNSVAAAPARAAAPKPDAPKAVTVAQKTALLDFSYAWPAEAAAIAPLDKRLRGEMEAMKKEALEIAAEDRKARSEMGTDASVPFNSHALQKTWRTAGQNGRLLSLAAETYVFTGGAHPNRVYDALLWDREAQRSIQPMNLFVNPAKAIAAINSLYCPDLDKERAKRREETLPLQGDEFLTGCPDPEKEKVAPADTDGDGRFDILRILLPPYEAGPYAEGSYEIDVGMTDALKALLKPEYRASF